MVTISTHNGSTVHQAHNVRAEKTVSKEAHIDPNGVHETWIHESARQAYHRLFDESVKAYNDKQTRKDRHIKNYYSQIEKDEKKHTVYEMIIGVYPSSQGEGISEEMQKAILKEFVDGWKERNPNLELIGAYYHADEQGEPHVHLDYIPIAHGYSRGMETQTGLVKALGEMGFEKVGKLTAQIQWQKRENDYLTHLCEERGLEVSHPKQEGREHLNTETYKAQKTLESAIDHVNDISTDIRKLEAKRDKINAQTQKALERKAKALKLHKDKYGSGYTYDKEYTKGIEKIAKEVKEEVKALTHTDMDIALAYEEAEAKRREAYKKEKEAAEYLQKEKEYILKTAESIAEEKFKSFKEELFPSEVKGYTKRLEGFCRDIKFKDGTSVLDHFKEQERQLQHKLNRDWER
ncbi:MAG: plasmid recombination protein [Treponemataceae bacterium]|nr:plasmid recombination protein [Treponemataceae bacterium]